MGKIKAEYIWMDGHKPTSKLRSKTKIIDGPVKKVEDIQFQILMMYIISFYQI